MEEIKPQQNIPNPVQVQPQEQPTELLKVVNLSKIFNRNKDNEVRALDQVNISVFPKEFISIMGPSGSGKTTLLNMLGVLDKPTEGEIYLNGKESHRIKERRLFKIRRENVGFIFQKFLLIPTLDVLQNVLAPLLPVGVKKEHRERAIALLKEVGLEKRIHHMPNKLSGGESQRVAIARALIMNPPIILADEPTGNLDSNSGGVVLNLMKNLNQQHGVSFIIVTHDPRVAMNTQRIIFLKDGKVHEEPTVDMPV